MSRRYYNGYGRGFVEPAVFKSLTDIQSVFSVFAAKIEQNGHITMADYYKTICAAVLPDDSKWGWTNLLECEIIRTRRGFELNMPSTVCLNTNPVQKAYDALCESESADLDDVRGFVEDAKSYLSSAL